VTDAAAETGPGAKTARPRLAIIGCGSSGLITLKTALAELPGWEIVCFERTGQITGCWGNPYPGFVSTSTKYTTQFACFPERDAAVEPDAGHSRAEFYRDAEYGEYLGRFADAFGLHEHIKLRHEVAQLARALHGAGWSVTYRSAMAGQPAAALTEHFDAVVICTGLAAQLKEIESPIPTLTLAELNAPDGIRSIRQERIVVFGGGESAVDYAARLSQPELGNEVYLSLRTGVRVSPRYHPIRGVPSDFLRNRLMLSIHPALRNWIGQRFVEARILHQELFEKWFPSRRVQDAATTASTADDSVTPEAREQFWKLRKRWAYKLTKAAKDELFNMFHNKSDDFLDCVARGWIQIVGPPVDDRLESFYRFDSQERIDIQPTRILPAIGYRSTLATIAGDSLRLPDFYLGCCHVRHPDLFLVGFARPIIGNIPTISEMQAAYVCGLMSGRFARPTNIGELSACGQQQNAERFAKLDLEAVYPVEMFVYCDRLARAMNAYPSWRSAPSLGRWWRMQLSPATTAHYYYHDPQTRRFFERAPVYMPRLLILLLLLLKPLDWAYRALHWLRQKPATPRNDQ
jgi:dimethylaniline monooxygenase (N-oxide forming)